MPPQERFWTSNDHQTLYYAYKHILGQVSQRKMILGQNVLGHSQPGAPTTALVPSITVRLQFIT